MRRCLLPSQLEIIFPECPFLCPLLCYYLIWPCIKGIWVHILFWLFWLRKFFYIFFYLSLLHIFCIWESLNKYVSIKWRDGYCSINMPLKCRWEGKNMWNNDSIKYIIALSTSNISSIILIFKSTTLCLKSVQLISHIQQGYATLLPTCINKWDVNYI